MMVAFTGHFGVKGSPRSQLGLRSHRLQWVSRDTWVAMGSGEHFRSRRVQITKGALGSKGYVPCSGIDEPHN